MLPFANRSNKNDDLFFTDGIHDDLLTQLAKIHDLKVISRTSMMEYRDTSKNLKRIGAELAVATILEGGVQKVGERIRVNAQLIEVATDRHLWAETYDRELTAENIFDIQTEIAREIVRAVAQLNLTGDLAPLQRVFEKMPLERTTNFVTYSAYVHWLQRDPDATIKTLNNPLWTAEVDVPFLRVFRNYELANAYRLKGDKSQAAEHYQLIVNGLEGAMKSALQVRAYGGMTIALSLARLNRFDEALALAEQLTQDNPYEKDAMMWGWLLTYQAMVKGLAGDQETAIDELEIALEMPSAFGITVWYLHYDPNWDFMRDNPRFAELATPANLIRTVTN